MKSALVAYLDCIGKLGKKITLVLQEIQVLSATNHDCIGSLHTFSDCKKCIESTVGIGTHVKPVEYTLIIFAVYSQGKKVSSCNEMNLCFS